MSSSIYSKLAWTNLKNNRKTYVPYVLTAILTVMMYYIIDALSKNQSVGKGNLQICLMYARGVVVVFAVIFLFYTNSFLIKRRKKEIGVYNILGMGKRHIAKMMALESGLTAVVSIVCGLFFGVIFSKLMYLLLLKILHYDVRMEFEITGSSLVNTLVLFVVIFILTLIYNLMQIRLSNPVELLHGGNQGEKEPKTKWILTLFGLITIGAGYYIAITVESPLAAIPLFFAAVILVVLGTYALFIAGSVAFLKMLKKRKNYFYQTKHFTSVSGMIYRMKQNAVGLANICILSTMVLVMVSTTASLYMGMDDVLATRFPTEFAVKNYVTDAQQEEQIQKIIAEETKTANVKVKSQMTYRSGTASALQKGNCFDLTPAGDYSTSNLCEFYMIPLADYNQMEGEEASLKEDEVMVYCANETYGKKTLEVEGKSFKVAKELDALRAEPKNRSRIINGYYIVFADEAPIQEVMDALAARADQSELYYQRMTHMTYQTSFDLEGDEKDCKKAMHSMIERINSEVPESQSESRDFSRESFYMLYGGLLFIGIYLGFMFLMATVLIIYYKQISEGYDDKERYQIMQKVGMGKQEVRRSIRSQVLTVFFLPLAAAVLHIAVAFKVITKLLAVLNLVNVPLFLTCTIVTIVIFAVFYAIIYSLTAREYYKIVN